MLLLRFLLSEGDTTHMSPSPRCFCPAETKRCRTEAARVPARLQNTKSLERRRRACEERKGGKLQSLYLPHFCCRGLTLSCARGRSLWLYNTGSPVGDKYRTATLSGPLLLGCYSNKEAFVVRSPQLKCCICEPKNTPCQRSREEPTTIQSSQ